MQDLPGILVFDMGERGKKRLGELLIVEGVLSNEHLQEALDHQKKAGGLIGQILVRLGYITEDKLVAVLGKQLGIPYLNLENYAVRAEAMDGFEEEFFRRHMAVIFDQDDARVFFAMADPLNETAIAEVEKRTGRRAQVFVSTPYEISSLLDLVFRAAPAKPALKKAG